MISLRHARQQATRVVAFAVALAVSGSMLDAAPNGVVVVKAKALHVGDGSIIQNGVILEGRCYIISHDLKHSAKDYIETEYARDNLSLERLFGSKSRAS